MPSNRLLEEVRAHVGGHLVLKLCDLVKQSSHDILGELVLILLLLSEPGEVLILQLHLVELLVEAVERLRVALLVDETLALSKGALELQLARSKLLDTVDLLLLLETSLFGLASSSLFLLAFGLVDTCLPVFELLLDHVELTLSFLIHGSIQNNESLLVLILDLSHVLL